MMGKEYAMSCHDIGHGMNAVSKTVLDLYESGQISRESTVKLICALRKGVHWCDGNEDEAIRETVARGYCGLCFEKREGLSNIFDNNLGYPERFNVFKKYDSTSAHFYLCPDCRRRVMDEHSTQ